MKVVYTLREGKSTLGLARAVRDFLKNEEEMETQLVELESGMYVVQGRARGGNFRQIAGLDRRVTVNLKASGTGKADMEIGKGKWLDKGIVAAVSLFVFWPLCICSAVGIYRQARLTGRIQRAAEEYLNF